MNAFLDGRVNVIVGDITRQQVDAIVNAANSSLMGGGGVDGAIHRAGGPAILAACKEIRRNQLPDGLPPGQAVITTGGNLPAPFVIHTVGPIYWEAGKQAPALLASCYYNSLKVAVEEGFKTMAFPAISTGVYGYPKDNAAAVTSQAIMDFLAGDERLEEVRLIFFSQGDAAVFLKHHKFMVK
jgi:O-acetyl-ADP-ribose deacetylase (regulator of RNase III)